MKMPNEKNVAVEEDERSVIAYTHLANHSLEDEKETFAKAVTVGKKTTYWILHGLQSTLFNPYGFDSEDFTRSRASVTRKGKREYVFKKVEEQVFSYYLKFLKTKNPLWLRHAEREKING